MSNRVNICGINTNTLPKLSHKELLALLERIKNNDEKAREEFIFSNLRLVLSIIQRFNNKKCSVEDIFQVGCIGLIKAMKNFNTDYNLRFSTYAVPMIIGEIRRFLRDGSGIRISRSIRDTAYKILQARQMLESKSDEPATIEDIAKAINIPVKEVVYCLDAISDPVSLFDPIYHDEGDNMLVMDQIKDDRYSDENWINNIILSESIKKLNEREKEILMLRFFEGKTQIEVCNEIGISQAQVSRLEKNAIESMRKLVLDKKDTKKSKKK